LFLFNCEKKKGFSSCKTDKLALGGGGGGGFLPSEEGERLALLKKRGFCLGAVSLLFLPWLSGGEQEVGKEGGGGRRGGKV